MASEITIRIWSDVAPDRALAQRLARQAVKEIRTSGGDAKAAVVDFDATYLEPRDVHDAARAFASFSEDAEPKAADETSKPKCSRKPKSQLAE